MKMRHVWAMFTLCLFMLAPFLFGSQPPQSNVLQARTHVVPIGELTNTTISSATQTPLRINITREEYETAKAKWLAQRVAAYQIVVTWIALSLEDGTWTLEVNGDTINIISCDCIYLSSPYGAGDKLKFLTVEGQFAQIERLLNASNTDQDIVVHVVFDPNLGYPTGISYSAREPSHASEPANISVKSLKIIKSAMPGMPRSGNPGP